MTVAKPKMSASYKAIFILSIFMVFFVLLAGAATNSKTTGFGMLIWGYTAWLMYKRRNADLVSFFKILLWFYVIAAIVTVAVLTFSDSDISQYVGYTANETILLFVIVILLTYGLYKYFGNLESNPSSSDSFDAADSTIWDQVSEEIKLGKRVDSLWTRAFSESDGDSNKANARYIKLRFDQIKLESRVSSSVLSGSSPPKESKKVKLTFFDFWNNFNFVGKLALIGILLLVGYGFLGGNMDPYFKTTAASKDTNTVSQPSQPSKPSQTSQTSQPSKSTTSDKPIKSIDEVNTVCYAYWDGRLWQSGKTEGDKFLRLKIGRYGVHILTFSLPIQMANEFGLSKESSTDVDLFKGEIGKFMNENWHKLEALCNFR